MKQNKNEEEIVNENTNENITEEKKDDSCSEEQNNLSKRLEELENQKEDYYNRFLRMQADFDNYRKRVSKEREEMYTLALENIVSDILPIVDNMERAVSSFRSDNLNEKYVEGVEMVCKQLIGVLEKNNVKEIQTDGQDFDPNLHHAVMQCDAEADDENKIKEVFQKGYLLGNKVVRPSLVKVAVKN